MRAAFCQAMLERAARAQFVFLTGDLGFMALEELREAMGPRFINAGVAEQNMIAVAAGMASEGLEVWVYSIAPFLYARPFEQIRNDVCLHALPVRLVGNGGGYGYGVMGPTHHALEDYGVLLTLPAMAAVLPAFDADVGTAVQRMGEHAGPAYLRLGRDEAPSGWPPPPAAAPWRCLLEGDGPVAVVAGPLAGVALSAFADLPPQARPLLWVLDELPLRGSDVPPALLSRLGNAPGLCVIEEHVAHGGLASMLALWLAGQGVAPRRFRHLHARGYPSGRYGSQAFHRHESGLDAGAMRAAIREFERP